jgi:hypothetical protein
VAPAHTLDEIRRHHAAQVRALPAPLRSLEPMPTPYAVDISGAVRTLAREVDARPG